ncbi:hypothetical protein BKA66DRAFT_436282 [Pyrenochaeta sp. MPI-SDFR-AT-0127]|nr:hypothetical protein BKA66DRAFT_436282 [Pyrenochaeta sp. MPI-SDFR-AT-0127]
MQREDVNIPRDDEKPHLSMPGRNPASRSTSQVRYSKYYPAQPNSSFHSLSTIVILFIVAGTKLPRCLLSAHLALPTLLLSPLLFSCLSKLSRSAMFGGVDVWVTTEGRVGNDLVESENHSKHGLVVLRNRAGQMMGGCGIDKIGAYKLYGWQGQVARIVTN